MTEIEFEPTSTEQRRERNERAVFSRLAAIEAAGRADIALALERPSPRRLAWIGGGFALAAAAAALLLLLRKPDAPAPAAPPAPQLVVTPIGGSSRFTVGDSIIDAGGDTSVQVLRGGDGAITLQLARGTIDCDVTPRNGRPPFRVVAGDVTVEVVGTRFAVARTRGQVRVDVTHGRVRVKSATEEKLLDAGGSWASGTLAANEAAAQPEPEIEPEIEIDPTPGNPVDTPAAEPPAHVAKPRMPTPRDAFAAAQKLEGAKRTADAAHAYRVVANGKDDLWAPLALYSLADLHAKTDAAAALAELDELARRFPHNANKEDAAWLRFQLLRRMGRTDDAKRAAAAYLRAYPNGTYADDATRIASP